MQTTAGVAIDVQIHHVMEGLTAAEKRVARALLANYPTLGMGPVADFGQVAGASAATVLRFIARLGFSSYPEFQRELRSELQQRIRSPESRAREPGISQRFLDVFSRELSETIRKTASRVPASEFEEICVRLSNGRMPVHVVGGQFTETVAQHLTVQLALLRPCVRKLETQASRRAAQLVDVKPADTAVIFDVAEYDPELMQTAKLLAGRGVSTILFTDEGTSPVSRYSKFVLPCAVEMTRSAAVSTVLLALVEAVIARTSEIGGAKARGRLSAIEALKQEHR